MWELQQEEMTERERKYDQFSVCWTRLRLGITEFFGVSHIGADTQTAAFPHIGWELEQMQNSQNWNRSLGEVSGSQVVYWP